MSVVTLDVFVAGRPRTKGSWRPITVRGKTRLVPQTKEKPWAKLVQAAVREAKPELLTGAAHVFLLFLVQRPKKTKLDAPRGDVDKMARSVLDALTGLAYQDDSQVTHLHASKSWASESGCRISVHRAGVL